MKLVLRRVTLTMSPLILYATETGNAENVADQIARHCRRIHLRCQLRNVEDYSPVRSANDPRRSSLIF